MRELVVSSPAKVNLHLQVLSGRPDGYHDIETIFHVIPLRDTMRIVLRGEGLKMECADPLVPLDSTNTIALAYDTLSGYLGYRPGVRVKLEKRIPIGGGLGGGSSNAASFLEAMNQLLDLSLTREQLWEMGRRVGADVPFFLSSATAAVGRGTGTDLEVIKSALEGFMLLAIPPFSVSTSWAYSSLVFPLTPMCTDINILALLVSEGSLDRLASNCFNHLEASVFARYPVMDDIKRGLQKRRATLALMSGSGSTIFGIFSRREWAEDAGIWASDKGCRICILSLSGVGV